MKGWTHIGFLLICVSATLGCGTMKAYVGPELPRDQVAIISFRYNWVPWTGQVYVEAVDGRRTKLPWSGNVAVRPGQHHVRLYVQHCNAFFVPNVVVTCSRTASRVLQFEAEASHTYVVRKTDSFFPRKEWIWIENLHTGQVVADENPE